MKLLVFFLFLFISAPSFAQPFELPSPAELNRFRGAIIDTNKGKIFVKLFPESAPWHVANFKYLADKKFYDGKSFHLFEENYVIQTGAADSNPVSGPGYNLPAEFNEHPHIIGALSMVRRPNQLDFDRDRKSHGSQFRIMLTPAPKMDGQYTVFGQVVKGFKVLKQLKLSDKIKTLIVYVEK